MRTSDRVLATGLAVFVWLLAGYAVASRTTAHQAITPAAFEATAAVGLGVGRP